MFTGRIDRIGYLLGNIYVVLPVILVIIAYAIINFAMSSTAAPVAASPDSASLFADAGVTNPARSMMNIVLFLVGIALVLPVSIGLSVRRWHDVNATGWLAILMCLPYVSFIVALVQLFMPGTNGANQYGDKHGRSSRKFKDVLFGSKSDVSPSVDNAAVAAAPLTTVSPSPEPETPPSPIASLPPVQATPEPTAQDEQKPPAQPPQTPVV